MIIILGTFTCGFIAGFIVNWKMAIGILWVVPIVFLLIIYQINKIDEYAAKGNEKNEEAGGIAEEIFYNIKTVQSFGNVSFEIKRFNEKIQEGYLYLL